jgi:short-subunit dehydrogenase
MDFAERYGPWAIVTGASSGIGEAFARLLAQRGVSVVLAARRGERLEAIAKELEETHGVATRPIALDVSLPTFSAELVASTGELDIGLVVSNAAARSPGAFCDVATDLHLTMLETNVRAPVMIARTFAPRLVERGRGGLILTSSIEAYHGFPYSATYAATKAFTLSLGEALYEELRESGVDVLVLNPGPTDTAMLRAGMANPDSFPGMLQPESVAAAALDALGRRPVLIPGLSRWMVRLLGLLPRRRAVAIVGRAMQATAPPPQD